MRTIRFPPAVPNLVFCSTSGGSGRSSSISAPSARLKRRLKFHYCCVYYNISSRVTFFAPSPNILSLVLTSNVLLNTERTADAGIPTGMPCHAMASTMTWHGIR